MVAHDKIILHHYDRSPFSEKVRLMLGLEGLAWRSVITPNIMPKPDLTPLTGGYRRAPVMQIGADVFCDSQVILAEIERRSPGPAGAAGPAYAVNIWADRLFFAATVPIIFGELGDKVPSEFIADRERLSGRPFDIAAMKAAGGASRGQWRAQASWIENALADGRSFLGGPAASVADIAAYMNVWFLTGAMPHVATELLAGFARLEGWRGRMAAIGHGRRTELTGPEALEIARTSSPAVIVANDKDDPLGLAPGDQVMVAADDYGRDPIVGALVAANAERVVIARDEAILGRLHLHFPRVGYRVEPG